jgi:3-oxoacyl-[acyl-carrier-protein] synthase II
MNSRQEVVITGVGVVAPNGIGVESFWDSLASGRSGISVRPRFEDVELPHRIAGSVQDFEGKKYIKPRKSLKIMCGPIQYGCAAARMAVDHAGFAADTLDPNRVGTVFGTETFFADPAEVADVFQKCTVDSEYQHERWGDAALREIQPLWMLKYLPNMAASHISIAMDARGPSNSICQGEASGLLALMEAADLIQRGVADVVVAGGTGSQLALTATLYRGTEMLSKRIDEPTQASRPFDRDRDGMVVGEGAGAIVLESASFAAARKAKVLARVAGWSRGFRNIDSPDYSEELQYHFNAAIRRAGLTNDQIELVNAHASGSLNGDRIEAEAIKAVAGNTPVVAYKSIFGNLGPGTSIVELAASVLSIEKQIVPPSANCPNVADDCPVNVLTSASDRLDNKPLSNVLKSSFSSTGQIAAVVIKQ